MINCTTCRKQYKCSQEREDYCEHYSSGYNSAYDKEGIHPERNPVFPKIINEELEDGYTSIY